MRFERDTWQAVIKFGIARPPQPLEIAECLRRLTEAFPGPQAMLWDMPTLSGSQAGAVVPTFQLVQGAGLVPLAPAFIVGTSPLGWNVELSAQQLTVTYGQRADGERRGIAPELFPTREAFGRVIMSTMDALPAPMRDAAERVLMMVGYAAHTGAVFPASWIGEALHIGQAVPYPPPDGTRMVLQHLEQEFATIDGLRCVWSDRVRVGNWFSGEGVLQQGSAVVWNVELLNAVPEPNQPGLRLATRAHRLEAETVRGLLAHGGGIGRLADRLRHRLPDGVELDE